METDVLIVGAGTTGLTHALWLSRMGVRVRVIDQRPTHGLSRRAFALQARSLEHYDQIGLAHRAVARGQRVETINVRFGDAPPQSIPLGDFGRGMSPYPFILVLLQDEHEKMLVETLEEEGVTVERGVQLVDLVQTRGAVRARLRKRGNQAEVCEAAYVCGCDGAASSVRTIALIEFAGEALEEIFYVADVEASGPAADGQLHYRMSGEDICSVLPLKGEGRVRLIGLVPREVRETRMRFDFDAIEPQVRRDLGLTVSAVESFETHRVHRRIATRWRQDRVFLLGDAAHVHSPAGGQGMNAGIGDAVNLAWKLAAAIRGRSGEGLLDSYEAERLSAARQITATTDRGFSLQTGQGAIGLVRESLARLAPGLIRRDDVRRSAFRTLSQLAIHYRDAETCAGQAGQVRGGDRLPWVELNERLHNFTALRDLNWQAQVYGVAGPALREACAEQRLRLEVFDWIPAMGEAGLARDAAYLVRPDGYVAYAGPARAPAPMVAQLRRFERPH